MIHGYDWLPNGVIADPRYSGYGAPLEVRRPGPRPELGEYAGILPRDRAWVIVVFAIGPDETDNDNSSEPPP